MKYLITGITGFVGPHLANRLIDMGHFIYGLCRKDVDYDNMKILMGDRVSKLSFLRCDLTDVRGLENLFCNFKFDGVFHMGGITHIPTSFADPLATMQANTMSTVAICEAIRKFNRDCVLMYCSSGAVYGTSDDGIRIHETFPMEPSNPYGVSKAASETYLNERTANGMIRSFTVRPFSHTGPGRRSNFAIASDAIQIARILKGVQKKIIKVGNLESRRAVMDVRDVVETYCMLMDKMHDGAMVSGEIFNVGAVDAHKIGYYLDMMLEKYHLTDVEIEKDPTLFRAIESPLQLPSTEKVSKFLEWNSYFPIETTLGDLVEYFIKRI